MDAETVNIEDSKTEVSVEGGALSYKLIGERLPESGPVTIVLPGHGGGIASHGRLAEAIYERVGQQTIVTSGIRMDQPTDFSESVIDIQATALLELLKSESLTSAPLNFVAHSLGALVVEKAAELAKHQGLDCFDYEKGSRTIFIAPSGTNERERPDKLLARVIFSFRNNNPKRPELDPDGSASTGDPYGASKIKDIRALKELGTKHLSYASLKDAGLKPAIIFYPDDRLYSWDNIARDPKYVELLMQSADGLMAPAGMIDKPKDSAFHPSQSDHYTVNYNVGPTADSIVDYFTRSRAHPNTL